MITHPCKAGSWRCGRYRDEARWGGANAQHCPGCGELFLSTQAGDKHRASMECRDPATLAHRDGRPVFEKVPKPTWSPPYAWRLIPRRRWAENPLNAVTVENLRPAHTPAGSRGSPGSLVGAEFRTGGAS